MLVLHHLEKSRSFRIVWMLEELGLDYELISHQRDPESNLAMADLKRRHPLGKAPLLEVDERVIAESGAILEYLLDSYDEAGRFRPPAGSAARIDYNSWMHAAEGSVMNLLLLSLLLGRMESGSPALIRPVIKKVTGRVRSSYLGPSLENMRAYIESELGRRTWFAGDDFSAADVQMGFVMMAMAARGGLDDGYPNCQRWMGQAESRSAYQEAIRKSGDMSILR